MPQPSLSSHHHETGTRAHRGQAGVSYSPGLPARVRRVPLEPRAHSFSSSQCLTLVEEAPQSQTEAATYRGRTESINCIQLALQKRKSRRRREKDEQEHFG